MQQQRLLEYDGSLFAQNGMTARLQAAPSDSKTVCRHSKMHGCVGEGWRGEFSPHLDSKAPGILMTAGQQDVVASKVAMQYIKLV